MFKSENRAAVGVVALLAILSLASFFVPAFIIRPFRYQSPHALSVAVTVRSFAPLVTGVALFFSLLLIVKSWRGASVLLRVGLVIALLLGTVSAVMTRLNYFEWMFQPIRSAEFVPAGSAQLAGQEMVMAVRFGSEARAYPVRQMAYHHVLNDTVAGVPVVVTY